MAYPNSSDVSAGQPTASAHYNNLRKDALYFGNAAVDSNPAGTFFTRFVSNLTIQYLASNRLRVPYVSYKPVSIMINGCALKATADVDLPSSQFSGGAATWYIFAVQTAGSTTFTLTVNTSPTESANTRLIGECAYDGSNVGLITCYFDFSTLPDADYDSGWFAVAAANTYTKTHGLGTTPRMVLLFHATDSGGTSEWVLVTVVQTSTSNELGPLGWTSTNIIGQSGATAQATCRSTRRDSAVGYWRMLAWI